MNGVRYGDLAKGVTNMRNRRYWALGLATALVLSACSTSADDLPTPIVETPTSEETDAGGDNGGEDGSGGQSQRADQVLDGISDALETAYSEQSIDNVRDRIGGPARLVLDATFENAERFGIEGLEPIPTTDPESTWGTSTELPRVAMVFTENPETGANDQLLVLAQSDGRENYKLWGFAALVPADAEITFASDAESFPKEYHETIAASPVQTVREYAMRLRDEETDVTYEDDGLAISLHDQRDSIGDSLGETGEARLGSRALDHGPITMSTEDGGAVTMGAIEYDVIIERTTAGSTITVGDELAEWMTGEADSTYDVEGTLTSTYLVTVAFYIPPKDGGNVQVIATSSPELVDVTDDESTNPDEEED